VSVAVVTAGPAREPARRRSDGFRGEVTSAARVGRPWCGPAGGSVVLSTPVKALQADDASVSCPRGLLFSLVQVGGHGLRGACCVSGGSLCSAGGGGGSLR